MKQFLVASFIALLGLLVPATAEAQLIKDSNTCAIDPSNVLCQSKDDQVDPFLESIASFLLWLVGVLSVIMLIWGGIKYTTSAGDSSKVTAAKNIILYSIIGLAVALLSFGIVRFIADNSSSNFSPTSPSGTSSSPGPTPAP